MTSREGMIWTTKEFHFLVGNGWETDEIGWFSDFIAEREQRNRTRENEPDEEL